MRKKSHLEAMTGLDSQRALFVIELLKDHDPVRAGRACGIAPDEAYAMSNEPCVRAQVDRVLGERLEDAVIDAQWLLGELRDNHDIARQTGAIAASNKALELIAKHVDVDAFASSKLEHSGELGLTVAVKRYSDDAVIEGEVTQEEALPGSTDALTQEEAREEGMTKGGGGPTAAGGGCVSFL